MTRLLNSKCSKFSNTSQMKCWLSRLEFTKCLSEEQTGKTLIRLLFQMQSDLGLPCLSRFCDRKRLFKILKHLDQLYIFNKFLRNEKG